MRQLRIACIGAGQDAHSRTRGYMAVIRRLPHLFDLCAVVDRDEAHTQEASEQFGIPAQYAHLDELLRDDPPDVVFRLTPTDSALPVIVRAAEAGCHVLSEIPIAITLPRADLAIEACRRHGVKLEIAENVWLWPQERLKRRIVEAGLVGEPIHARLSYPCGSYHGFNAVRMILGADPEAVLGFGGEVPVEERIAYGGEPMSREQWDGALLRFPGHLQCLFDMPPKRPAWRRHWSVEGTRGHLDDDVLTIYERGEERPYPIEWVYDDAEGQRVLRCVRVNTGPPVEWENPYATYGISEMDDVAKAALLESIHRAVVDDTEPIYGAANARRDMELCIALKESAWQGSRWLDLPLQAVTSVEERLHEAFRERYGCDPLGDIGPQLDAAYDRTSVMWTVAGWL